MLVAVQIFGSSHAVEAAALPPGCVNADPTRLLANVNGDFEISNDPQDPQQNLIYASNTATGSSKIVVARIDRSTGILVGGSLTTIATNYIGDSYINGPEFLEKPDGKLGLLYRGPQGVHAAFRANPPSNWNAFSFNLNGTAVSGSSPLPLPLTIKGNYPATGMPFQLSTYGEGVSPKKGNYGPLSDGKLTDIVAALKAQGLTFSSAAQSPRDDGWIFISASGSSSGSGIYEAQINSAGGFTPGSLVKIATAPVAPQETVRAIRHPATGTTVLFTNAGKEKISV